MHNYVRRRNPLQNCIDEFSKQCESEDSHMSHARLSGGILDSDLRMQEAYLNLIQLKNSILPCCKMSAFQNE